MSAERFSQQYPAGKVHWSSPGYNKTFICRRGCNTRTATYTPEFIWEDIYRGREQDVAELVQFVKRGTQSTRRGTKRADSPAESAYVVGHRENNDEDDFSDNTAPTVAVTPRKKQKTARITTPSSRKYVPLFLPTPAVLYWSHPFSFLQDCDEKDTGVYASGHADVVS